ncbi:MAG: hypothetical protein ABH885_05050, partial [Candidatus Omnitrophota bacterium]
GTLTASQCYTWFEAERERIFSGLKPEEFFNPYMKDLIYIVKALNPDLNFVVNTALDSAFFERQFRKRGFRGSFLDSRSLTKEERENRETTNRNKCRNFLRIAEERGLRPEQVVVIDDSAEILKMAGGVLPGCYRIGVVANPHEGGRLLDSGCDALIFNMKPTHQKLRLFDIPDDRVGDIRRGEPSNGVYLINSKGKHVTREIDPIWAAKYQKHIPFIARTALEREGVERAFQALVTRGEIRPNVVVNIKNFSPNAVAVYMRHLLEISARYNGNVTFVLVVEENVEEYAHDMPSAFNALYKARAALGKPFSEQMTFMIADGGRKIRGMPFTLAYLYEGLIPYAGNRTRLEEVFVRTGGMLMQMPHYGREDCALVSSDSVFHAENWVTSDSRRLHQLPKDRRLVVPASPLDIGKKSPGTRILRAAFQDGKTAYVLAKAGRDVFDAYRAMSKFQGADQYSGLHFLTLWYKPFLGEVLSNFAETGVRHRVEDVGGRWVHSEKIFSGDALRAHGHEQNTRWLIDAPCDMYRALLQSIFMEEDEWASLLPRAPGGAPLFSELLWARLRYLARAYLGNQGEKVIFMDTSKRRPVRDEGVLKGMLKSYNDNYAISERNTVTKSPDVQLHNATAQSLDHVIIKGRGRIIFGNKVRLKNVVIELRGDDLHIPANWTAVNSYIGPGCRFNDKNGCLMNCVYQDKETGMLRPVENAEFSGSNVCTVTRTIEGVEVLVAVPKNATKKDLAQLRFGGYSLEELQENMDVERNIRKVEGLREWIYSHFARKPGIFPLCKDAVTVASPEMSYNDFVVYLADEITRRMDEKLAEPEKSHFWLNIEAPQGGGKTYLLDALRRELESRGKKVAIVEEDWYHKSRQIRERMRAEFRGRHISRWIQHFMEWHYWKKLQRDLRKIAGSREGEYELTNLYNRDHGGDETRTEQVQISRDTIVMYSGFYISDKSNVDVPCDILVYLGITIDESLAVKLDRDRWRGGADVLELHETVYAPAFRRYIETNDPAAQAEIVASINVNDRSRVRLVRPLTKDWFNESTVSVLDFLTCQDMIFFSEFLSDEQIGRVVGKDKADAILLIGNSEFETAEKAAVLYLRGLVRKIYVAGTRGRETERLIDRIRKSHRYDDLVIDETTKESDIFSFILMKNGVKKDDIFVAPDSFDTKTHMALTIDAIIADYLQTDHGDIPRERGCAVIVMHHSLMMRKAMAHFNAIAAERGISKGIRIKGHPYKGLIPNIESLPEKERLYYYAVILGELNRLAQYFPQEIEMLQSEYLRSFDLRYELMREAMACCQRAKAEAAARKKATEEIGLPSTAEDEEETEQIEEYSGWATKEYRVAGQAMGTMGAGPRGEGGLTRRFFYREIGEAHVALPADKGLRHDMPAYGDDDDTQVLEIIEEEMTEDIGTTRNGEAENVTEDPDGDVTDVGDADADDGEDDTAEADAIGMEKMRLAAMIRDPSADQPESREPKDGTGDKTGPGQEKISVEGLSRAVNYSLIISAVSTILGIAANIAFDAAVPSVLSGMVSAYALIVALASLS